MYPEEQECDTRQTPQPPTTAPTTNHSPISSTTTTPLSPLSNDSILGNIASISSTNATVDNVLPPLQQVVASIPALSQLGPPKRKKFRMKLFSFLCQPKVEVVSAGTVLLSSLLVALSTLKDLPTDVIHVIASVLWMLDCTIGGGSHHATDDGFFLGRLFGLVW
jgi:hypothetical protein